MVSSGRSRIASSRAAVVVILVARAAHADVFEMAKGLTRLCPVVMGVILPGMRSAGAKQTAH